MLISAILLKYLTGTPHLLHYSVKDSERKTCLSAIRILLQFNVKIKFNRGNEQVAATLLGIDTSTKVGQYSIYTS